MTPKQADKIIKKQKPVTVRSKYWDETFTKTFNYRNHFDIHSDDGGVFDRQDLIILKTQN